MMKKISTFLKSFTPFEAALWFCSVAAILLSFFLCGNTDYVNLTTSLIGACSLILVSKGNVAGQFLVVVFSVFYGVVSFYFRYYGEMVTYLGMSAPMAIASVILWLKNPYQRDSGVTEVKVNKLSKKEWILLIPLSLAVTVAFYFILKAFHTANLIVSTVSVLTSFLAVYLCMRRCEFYALAYALNDVVLIVLWALAARADTEYIALVICFVVFLINDLYGFWQWSRMKRRQKNAEPPAE